MKRLRAGWLRLGLAACFGAFALTAGATLAGATAASPCANSKATPDALTTMSADGTKVYGSACPDLIVVTDPQVQEVQGGEGDDTIYVSPYVEKVVGGPGDDVIYGELPEELEGGEEGPATPPQPPTYQPAPNRRAARTRPPASPSSTAKQTSPATAASAPRS